MIRSAYSDGFVGFASSKVGEDSLSHHVDLDLGVYMVDRFGVETFASFSSL